MSPEIRPTATDPVCGMTVDIVAATRTGLTVDHAGLSYFFCAKGCKLDFLDDPASYLGSRSRAIVRTLS